MHSFTTQPISRVTFSGGVLSISFPLTLFAIQAVIVARSRLLKPSKASQRWLHDSISQPSSEHWAARETALQELIQPSPPPRCCSNQTNYSVYSTPAGKQPLHLENTGLEWYITWSLPLIFFLPFQLMEMASNVSLSFCHSHLSLEFFYLIEFLWVCVWCMRNGKLPASGGDVMEHLSAPESWPSLGQQIYQGAFQFVFSSRRK